VGAVERLADRLAEVGLLELADRVRRGEFTSHQQFGLHMIVIRELWKYPFPEARQIRQEIAEGKYDD
jgi:ribulose 1,5-bisphosphate carboxylase large subunit-like protein